MATTLSIVIVTSDRTADLRRCLTSLRAHRRGPGVPPVEILTVHPPHDVDSLAMVRADFPEATALVASRRHISEQRNLGARHATAEVLVYLDDDAWPHDGWLAAIAEAFAAAKVVAASGPVRRGDGTFQCRRLASSRIGRLVPLADGAPLPAGMAPSFSGCNLAIRRRALFAAGGFDENLPYQPDDMDVCARLFAQSGCDADAFRFDERIEVTHESSPGPYRRTLQDRAWFVVARDNMYYACRHGGRLRGLLGGALLQAPKLLRFGAWLLRGRLGPTAFLRCLGKHVAGTFVGAWKGLTHAPRLPLRPLPTAIPDAAAAAAATALPRPEPVA
jgi:GT2 family glycosyltransferase